MIVLVEGNGSRSTAMLAGTHGMGGGGDAMAQCLVAAHALRPIGHVAKIGENIYRPLLDGPWEGDDARDVLTEAIEWWHASLMRSTKRLLGGALDEGGILSFRQRSLGGLRSIRDCKARAWPILACRRASPRDPQRDWVLQEHCGARFSTSRVAELSGNIPLYASVWDT
jgi:hypothetical protein